MESTVVVDCGRHSVKYTSLSKRNRRMEGDMGVLNDISPSTTRAVDVSLEDWNEILPKVLLKELDSADDLTLFLLMHTLFPRKDRELLFTACFEHLGAKKVCLGYSAVTALFAGGEVSGVSVDLGHTAVRVTPVYQGVPCTVLSQVHATVGSAHVDAVLDAECTSCTFTPQELIALKSQACWVGNENTSPFVEDITLPDGNRVRVPFTKKVAMDAGQRLLYSSKASVPDSFQNAYQSFNIDCRGCPHWTVFGGAAEVSGVCGTLADALAGSLLLTEPIHLRLHNPCYAPVEGAAILTHLNTFKAMCVGVDNYEEDGPERCVHSKLIDSR